MKLDLINGHKKPTPLKVIRIANSIMGITHTLGAVGIWTSHEVLAMVTMITGIFAKAVSDYMAEEKEEEAKNQTPAPDSSNEPMGTSSNA